MVSNGRKKKSSSKRENSLTKDTIDKLLSAAVKARKNAYAPYSSYKVGAAVLTEDGKIFIGSNVENAVYGATVCAERNAVFKAVNEGYRSIKAVAVVAKPMKDNELVKPCGICRQVLSEFGDDIIILLSDTNATHIEKINLKKLFPDPFKLDKKRNVND